MTENGNTQTALEYAKGRKGSRGWHKQDCYQTAPPSAMVADNRGSAITNKLFTARPYGDILSLFPSNLLIHARGIARF